jgi:hypothetical protein
VDNDPEMNASTRTAWGGLVLAIVTMTGALLVWAVDANEPLTPDVVLYLVAYLAFAAVGALIVNRHPKNVIGLLALATGVAGSIVGLFDSVGRLKDPVIGQEWAAWIAIWGFPATLAPALLMILLFPTGRLASPRWRIIAASVVIGALMVSIGNAFTPRMVDFPGVRNPVGIDWFQGSSLESGGVGWFPLLAGAVAAALGLVPRLRRARGVERQQLKWITYAAALQGAGWMLVALDLRDTAGELAVVVVLGTLLLIPIATGIAILRYRLYDIDVVIRRTLVYGAVVAILGALYVALVLGLQSLLSNIIGGDTLPVALSTLAIAVLFGPVRGRVRDVVDRRFYRSRYDHERLLEAFGNRLRDEVELDSVSRSLTSIADQAVRPARITLWLRGGPRLSGDDGQ